MGFGTSPFGSAPFGSGADLQPAQLLTLPTVLLRAIVEVPRDAADGKVVECVGPAWHMLLDLLSGNPGEIFKIPPRKMEEMIAAAYHESGFDEVILTPPSGDLGRDVIATKKGVGRVRVVDQVKAYKPSHLVTAEEVRALGFVALAENSKGVVTTTSNFAPRITTDRLLKPFLDQGKIELVSGEQLLQLLATLRRK